MVRFEYVDFYEYLPINEHPDEKHFQQVIIVISKSRRLLIRFF